MTDLKEITSIIEGEETMREEEKYITDQEFKNLIKRTDEEYARLKEAIRIAGRIHTPVAVWKEERTLVDGYGRDQIYEELKEELGEAFNIKPPEIIWMSFASRDEAKLWMVNNQFTHRNMNSFRRIEAALQFKPYFEEMARSNQKAGVSPDLVKGIVANKEVAKFALVKSPETVRKVTKILEKAGDPEVTLAINALFKDEKDFSIDGVYKKYCKETEPSSNSRNKSGGDPISKQPTNDPSKETPERVEELPTEDTEQTQSEGPLFDDADLACVVLPPPIEESAEAENSNEAQPKNYLEKFTDEIVSFKHILKQRPNDLSKEEGEMVYREFQKFMDWTRGEYEDVRDRYDPKSKR